VTVELAPYDATFALNVSGVLGAFNRAAVLTAADVHVATTLGRLSEERDEQVLLAVALAVRGVREGAVCIDLGDARRTAGVDAVDVALPWPADLDAWYAACAASRLVAVGVDGDPGRPVRLVDRRLYLDRYWRQEQLVRWSLAARAEMPPRGVDPDRLHETLSVLFPGDAPDYQRLAAAACAVGAVTIVAGGPGTGKTTTVARMVALLSATRVALLRVALAAPTGKAAARLEEAVAAEDAALTAAGKPSPGKLKAVTLHRLLGWRPGSHTRFRHDRTNRLPYDVVVVDETSMVSLTMMARLLDAVRPDAALVLVGDPDQLASVEAGAVLGDLVMRPPRDGDDARVDVLAATLPDDVSAETAGELRNDVVRLRKVYRFGETITRLAEAIRTGQPDAALDLLVAGGEHLEFIADADLTRVPGAALAGLRADTEAAGRALHAAAVAGDDAAALAALDEHRLLCAHRSGPYGMARWGREVERWLDAVIPGYRLGGDWYVGRPLIITANDYEAKLYNGDTGAIVDDGDGGVAAAFGRGGKPMRIATSRLDAVETMHALTVHRSQGSQFERVTLILPEPDSPLLTRELFYTAVTRAKSFVRVVGSLAAVRAAVGNPVRRPSGLRER
jgi:exodeoxyribonuclease V alpha subunit